MVNKNNNSASSDSDKAPISSLKEYAIAAGNLYGVISVSDFAQVFDLYEEKIADIEEIKDDLSRLSKEEGAEFGFVKNHILGRLLLINPYMISTKMKDIASQQKFKQRYLPNKTEFLRYIDLTYVEPKKPYSDLKSFILKNNLIDESANLNIDQELTIFHSLSRSFINVPTIFDRFLYRGYKFKSVEEANAFIQQITNAVNNTRLFGNNGHTPNEIHAIRGR
jgi:hypothetical protein